MSERFYRITVRGVLSDRFAAAFLPMELVAGDGTTVLTGVCVDASALYGVLERARDLNLELLDVRSAEPGIEAVSG